MKIDWLLVILGSCVVAIVVLSYYVIANHNEMMRQCLDDGRKEYECYGIVSGRGY